MILYIILFNKYNLDDLIVSSPFKEKGYYIILVKIK